jgi:hypothetical protein
MASRNRTGQQRRVSDPLGLKERQTDYDHLQHPKIVEELKTELDFSSWYQGVEDGLLEASYEEYQ